jgi:hypothetical protein
MKETYKTKCRWCEKPIVVEYSYDYEDGGRYKSEFAEYHEKCKELREKQWEKDEAKEALEGIIFVKDIKQLSNKEKFLKNYDTLGRMGIHKSSSEEVCRWCGSSNLFDYSLNDWEDLRETMCLDCMKKILIAVETYLSKEGKVATSRRRDYPL